MAEQGEKPDKSRQDAEIRVLPLGAGQDVGKSCIIITIRGRVIMLDCGMHMGYNDHRRFPDFSYLSKDGNFNGVLDCLLISHFHLDHCGALPYFTERLGYNGSIIMSAPTKAICPVLLEDYRKITMDRDGGIPKNFFTSDDIRSCMAKVTTINVHETIKLDDECEIKAYYAGHVLGAVMFHIRVGNQSVVYTGDYNMTPDRHLGSAWIDRCRPDLLITESTYAIMIRDSKRARERDFLKKVHACVSRGGKVLIPCFAVGRAQELCILLDTYWGRLSQQQRAPIYFSGGLTSKSNVYYKLFITWTNQKLKQSLRLTAAASPMLGEFDFYGTSAATTTTSTENTTPTSRHTHRNPFDFYHIKPFDRRFASNSGPMVLFASPGMLHGGLSLDIFKKWASDPANMIILPGYCVPGTVGAKVLALNDLLQRHDQKQSSTATATTITPSTNKETGVNRIIQIDKHTTVTCNMEIENLSFSAHADAKGIMQLIRMCEPDNVMLVHGERNKMAVLRGEINREFNIPVFDPPNHTHVSIPCNGGGNGGNAWDKMYRTRHSSSNGCRPIWISSRLFNECSDTHRRRMTQQIAIEAEAMHFGTRVNSTMLATPKTSAGTARAGLGATTDDLLSVPYINPRALPLQKPSPMWLAPFRGLLVSIASTKSNEMSKSIFNLPDHQVPLSSTRLITVAECLQEYGSIIAQTTIKFTVIRQLPMSVTVTANVLNRIEQVLATQMVGEIVRGQQDGLACLTFKGTSVQVKILRLQETTASFQISWSNQHDELGSLISDEVLSPISIILM